jgi:KDO2-lipid IV(A) lauroyltransferase
LAEILEYWLARAILALLEFTPLPVANALGRACARLLDLAVPRLRRIARRNLELAGLKNGDVIINGVFESIGRLLVAFARFPRISRTNIDQWIRYEGLEHFIEAKKRGRGVLFATAHLGNWELSAFAHGLMTEPMNIVVRSLDNARIDALVEARRRLSGNRVIEKWDSARQILRALHRNEGVGILVDQNVQPHEGVFIDFFGVPACAGSAFVKIAAHTGAIVIPGFALWMREERRYVLRFYPPVEITGDVAADTQRLHSVIEGVIREYPDQWLWIHRRWKTRPPEGPPVY